MENAPNESNTDSAETHPSPQAEIRCVHCDTVIQPDTTLCQGCGRSVEQSMGTTQGEPRKTSKREIELGIVNQPEAAVTEWKPSARTRSNRLDIPGLLIKAATLLVVAAAIWTAFSLRNQPPSAAEAPVTATATFVGAIAEAVATETPFPTVTASPSSTPTVAPSATPEPTSTSTPIPTPTLEPPYEHLITEGEALYNIGLRYAVSVDSIIAINAGLSPERIVSGTTIQVPRPTATPPLEPVLVTIGEEMVMANPDDCQMHEIQEADTFFGIARLYNVPLDALLVMNRLSAETLLSPGDTVCIPTIIYNATSLEAGSGDYGGAVDATRPILLLPVDSAELPAAATPITLQWLAQRELEANEWYMIELTSLTDSSARPQRAFTKNTSFQLSAEWQPATSSVSTYRWRVSYVQATGERADGAFVYRFGGPSNEATFSVLP